jgi:hypothetical protein
MRFAAPVHARQSVDVVQAGARGAITAPSANHNATPLASWIEKQR